MTVLKYRVPYADTDQMGVVYYANYFEYFERFRNEILRDAGYTYLELEKEGIAMPVIEAVCHYKASAKYDDLLEITRKAASGKRVRTIGDARDRGRAWQAHPDAPPWDSPCAARSHSPDNTPPA